MKQKTDYATRFRKKMPENRAANFRWKEGRLRTEYVCSSKTRDEKSVSTAVMLDEG